jgi:hypothetical protein
LLEKGKFLLRPIWVLLPAGEAAPLEAQPEILDKSDVVSFAF